MTKTSLSQVHQETFDNSCLHIFLSGGDPLDPFLFPSPPLLMEMTELIYGDNTSWKQIKEQCSERLQSRRLEITDQGFDLIAVDLDSPSQSLMEITCFLKYVSMPIS